MQVTFEAVAPDGQIRSDTMEAASPAEAAESLRRQGLLVLNLRSQRAPAGAPRMALFRWSGARGADPQERALFAREMKMLLESGAPLVDSLSAVERQSRREPFRRTLRSVRQAVEEGATLARGMETAPDTFDESMRSMIAAGEATGTLSQSFARLSDLLEEQLRVRKTIAAAMAYPAMMLVLIGAALITIITFVVPRFRVLFEALRAPVPVSTQILFAVSGWLSENRWTVLLVGGLAAAGLTALLRRREGRALLLRQLMRVPLIRSVGARIGLARLLRVWSAMLSSHVPLLDTVRQSADAVRGTPLAGLAAAIEESLTTGGRIGTVLSDSPLVPPVVASAIATAESNARLPEAVTFVSRWLDEDNARVIRRWTQFLEPLMLVVMGVIVGTVATSLFIPLFDMATAAR